MGRNGTLRQREIAARVVSACRTGGERWKGRVWRHDEIFCAIGMDAVQAAYLLELKLAALHQRTSPASELGSSSHPGLKAVANVEIVVASSLTALLQGQKKEIQDDHELERGCRGRRAEKAGRARSQRSRSSDRIDRLKCNK